MKNFLTISMIAFLFLAFYSCNKDEPQTTNPTNVNSMAEFNAAHKKPTQTFTLNASLGGSITTIGGIEFLFPANSLVNSSGNLATGNVEVQIDEVISKADLLFNQISTHSDGRPLKSGGAFKIKVTQGSEELSMATGQQYHVWLTSNYSEPLMETYFGLPTNDQYGNINWTTTAPGITQNVFTYSTDSINVYEMLLENFDWINCDHPYDTLFAELNITLPTGAHNCQIMVMDNSSMLAVHLWDIGNAAKWDYAPLNISLSLLVLQNTTDGYKISTQAFTFTGQQVIMPSFVTISEADLEMVIQSYQ